VKKSTNDSQNVNIVFMRIKQMYGLRSDADLARHLGMNPSTVAMHRTRGKTDYERIIRYCGDADLNWIFRGAGVGEAAEVTYGGNAELKQSILELVDQMRSLVERL
jgi:hypothetical protein